MATRKKVIQQRHPLGRLLSEFTEEEEDETEDRIIPDGGKVRVRLDMMDSLQKAVAQDKVNIDSGPMIVDALGRGDRYSLSKPGARYLSVNPSTTDHAELVTRERVLADAYAEYDREAENAWRANNATRTLGAADRRGPQR